MSTNEKLQSPFWHFRKTFLKNLSLCHLIFFFCNVVRFFQLIIPTSAMNITELYYDWLKDHLATMVGQKESKRPRLQNISTRYILASQTVSSKRQSARCCQKSGSLSHNKMSGNSQKQKSWKQIDKTQLRYCTETVLDLEVPLLLLRAASDLPQAASKQNHSERPQLL